MKLSSIMAALAAFLFTAALANPAQAKPRHHHSAHRHAAQRVANVNATDRCQPDNNGRVICWRGSSAGSRASARSHRSASYSGQGVIGGRPAGCPHAFCGCGLSIKLFGRIRPELNLAWNWTMRFPRAAAAPGMAAVRHGHVMGLLSHVAGNNWLVYDANSGGGLIREHVRSIAGYVIVNPHASRMASQ